MRVLIVPEDPTLDQHVLKPVVQRIFADIGRSVRVDVLTDPHLMGISQTLSATTIAEVVQDNPMIDLFLLMVDRDCDRFGNTAKAEARKDEHPDKLIPCLACQEVEVWALALHRQDLPHRWTEVRAECDPKERYFDPFIEQQGWLETVGRGRKRAMRNMGRSWSGLLQVCPEIAELKMSIESWLETK